ncbi:hypothetical protein V8B97DRAFT_1920653 [Scleroderma yunnanense]
MKKEAIVEHAAKAMAFQKIANNLFRIMHYGQKPRINSAGSKACSVTCAITTVRTYQLYLLANETGPVPIAYDEHKQKKTPKLKLHKEVQPVVEQQNEGLSMNKGSQRKQKASMNSIDKDQLNKRAKPYKLFGLNSCHSLAVQEHTFFHLLLVTNTQSMHIMLCSTGRVDVT